MRILALVLVLVVVLVLEENLECARLRTRTGTQAAGVACPPEPHAEGVNPALQFPVSSLEGAVTPAPRLPLGTVPQ
ncbi:MAG: hypothetical protein JXB04_06860 [Kiritimatiellae bacterium]|nr:hypothetical protein [Kiritimatiellia bacterium]